MSAKRPKKTRVTLKQVAAAAKVDVATASRVLAGKARDYRISTATEEAVKRIAAEMQYQPNRIAQSLRTRKSGLIGVVVPDISNPFFSTVAKQVAIAADEHGYSVLLADSRDSTEAEEKLVDQLWARQVEGLVVCPVGVEFEHLLAVREDGCPLVLADRVTSHSDLITVTFDSREASERLLNLLYDAGHTCVGVIQGLVGTLPNEERLGAYKRISADRGHGFDPSLVRGDQFSEQSGYDAAVSLLKARSDITALFALSAPNAIGALNAALELGRSVPADLSIVAFDDFPMLEHMKTPLTTAAQDVNELGRVASRLLIEQIQSSSPLKEQHVLLPVTVKERHSVQAM